MEKSYKQIIGTPIVVEGLGKVARITDILIDHKSGKVCCFFVDQGKMKILIPLDILFFGQVVTIRDGEDIIDAEDVIKVQECLNSDIRIFKSRVETKKGEYLGNVQNFLINIKAFGLTKIIVYKSLLGLFKSQDRIISARDIIEIKKGLIVVKNKCAKVYDEEEERVAKLYPDMA
ncbi:PRC-barrel domain-containing protein [Patescibacteria group bacterium]